MSPCHHVYIQSVTPSLVSLDVLYAPGACGRGRVKANLPAFPLYVISFRGQQPATLLVGDRQPISGHPYAIHVVIIDMLAQVFIFERGILMLRPLFCSNLIRFRLHGLTYSEPLIDKYNI